jgi:xanthine dehydrogenase accessory factor
MLDELILRLPTPFKAAAIDNPIDIIRFAIAAFSDGAVALATLVEIRGGAARQLGAHVAVAEDGRYCGYVSGGCVEAAVACEALQAIAEGKDRVVRFGEGGPLDIVLPCGGGISVAIHVLRDAMPLERMLVKVNRRSSASMRYRPTSQTIEDSEVWERARFVGKDFVTTYRPSTRLIVAGQGVDTHALVRIAKACGYEAFPLHSKKARQFNAGKIDPFTAIILLHHDLDDEEPVLDAALRSSAFYIGALGSTRTHSRRVSRLTKAGWDRDAIDRIKAPIGIFGPTRESVSLALSVLADVAASRLTLYA